MAFYEETLSRGQAPQVDFLPAVSAPISSAGNIVEKPLPSHDSARIGIEGSTPPPAPAVPAVVVPAAASSKPVSLQAMPAVDSAPQGPGVRFVGKQKPAPATTSRGKGVPFKTALQMIAPKGWEIETGKFGKQKVSWSTSGKPWTSVLNGMAKQVNAVITVNWSAGSIQCSQPGSVAKKEGVGFSPAVQSPVQGGLVQKAIISSPGTGAEVAKRYKVPVDDFCRWNAFGKTTPLPAGYEVYLSPPPAGTVIVANMPVTPELSDVNYAPAGGVHQIRPSAAIATPSGMVPVASPLPIASAPPVQRATPVPSVHAPISPPEADVPQTEAAPTPTAPIKPQMTPIAAPLPVADAPIVDDSPQPIQGWSLNPGALSPQLSAWSAAAGYQLIWSITRDFNISSFATYSGDYKSALKRVLLDLSSQGFPIRIRLSNANKVVVVEE